MTLFKGLRAQRLLALLVAASAVLSYPLLALLPDGLWVLPLTVFGAWAWVIVALALLAERPGGQRGDPGP